jgi:NADH-quinone oxidoreductase subunit B
MDVTTLLIGKARNVIDYFADPVFNWGRRNSIWMLHLGIKCCALEWGPFIARFDAERFGIGPRASPRHCDLMIVAGPITHKFAPKFKMLYEQMPEPKWVIAMGDCAISGGPFFDSYNIIRGVDKLVPVDVYVPGCPPRPETMLDGMFKLQELIKKRKGGYYTCGP